MNLEEITLILFLIEQLWRCIFPVSYYGSKNPPERNLLGKTQPVKIKLL
jgi:hypothetical protein